jgi:hypothetical protein
MLPPALRRRAHLCKLLLSAFATLVGLILAEGGTRIYRALRGEAYHAAAAEARLDALIDELHGAQFLPEAAKTDLAKSGMAIHPYQGYQIAWYTRSGQDTVRYFASPEAEANFDIVLIGGSVAAEFGNWSGQYLIPALAQDPRLAGRQIRLHNVACPGHKQPQHAMTLQWLLSLGWKPDAVLLLDGFNELAVSAENVKTGVNPLFPYWIEMQMRLGTAISDPEDMELVGRAIAAREEAEGLRARLQRLPLTASAIAGSWALRTLEGSVNRARGRMLAVQEHEAAKKGEVHSLTIAGPGFDSDPAAVLAQCVEAWREGSRSMQAICRARAIPFLHVLQPAACDPGSKALTAEEAAAAQNPPLWAEAIARGYPRLREVGAELSREGINFLDATRVFAGHAEPIYRDGCHFGDKGCAILGPVVAEAFLRAWKE